MTVLSKTEVDQIRKAVERQNSFKRIMSQNLRYNCIDCIHCHRRRCMLIDHTRDYLDFSKNECDYFRRKHETRKIY